MIVVVAVALMCAVLGVGLIAWWNRSRSPDDVMARKIADLRLLMVGVGLVAFSIYFVIAQIIDG